MCFAPQRHALFRHLNLQKWSDPGVFCTFWLRNVLCATTACTFSTFQLPKVVRAWCTKCILTSKCASRYNGVHFFDIATSKSGPTLRCFIHLFYTFWLWNVLRAATACTFCIFFLWFMWVSWRFFRLSFRVSFKVSCRVLFRASFGVVFRVSSKISLGFHLGLHLGFHFGFPYGFI